MSKTLEQIKKDEIFLLLRDLYPTEPGTVLLGWVDKLYEHDSSFSLPSTDFMRQYAEHDEAEKQAKGQKEFLRQAILNQFKALDHPVKGITHREETRITWNHEKLFEYIEKSYPQLLHDLRAKAIDIGKLEEKVAAQEVSMPPSDTYKENIISVLTVEYPKKVKP